MFQKTKLRKGYLSAIGMSLVLLLVNTLGILLGTGVGQITPPANDTWINYTTRPSGSGTSESDPYQINSARNLAYLIDNLGAGSWYIELNADINLAGHEWYPIKTTAENSVVFKGNGHTISNMKINLPNKERYAGLFAGEGNGVTTLKIQDLVMSNVQVNAVDQVGAIIGSANGNSQLENITVHSGELIGNNYVGGITGVVGSNVQINNCYNEANIYGKNMCVGGIVGESGGYINNCFNSGNIWAESAMYVGGIVGYSYKMVDNSLAECIIYGAGMVGGISGRTQNTIQNSGFIGTIYCDKTPFQSGAIASHRAFEDVKCDIKNCFAVATIHIAAESDLSGLHKFGMADNIDAFSTYCYTNIYISENNSKKEYRKYRVNDNEKDLFSGFAYHKNINGGYPFPKTLFAVGQFIESDVLGYLEEYGFNSLGPPVIKNDGTHYYVELGQYPQTWVGSSMNTTLENWYSGKPVVDTYTIDNGTSSTSNVHNAYKYTDGNTYVRVSGIAYNSDSHFEDGTKITTGTIYWFRVEPIKWWVLNYDSVQKGSAPIVISERGLTANVTWNKSTSDQNLWASKSNIRTWLNGTFYNDTFDGGYKEYIKTTTVKNNTSSSNTDGTGTDTQDNVWLLSYTEASNKYEYLNTDAKRVCKPTDFCRAQNAIYTNSINSACTWWLRSAYPSSTSSAQFVHVNGYLDLNVVSIDSRAVRPALTLVI